MCHILLDFNYKKAVQTLNFLAIAGGGRINKMKALKLVYFADRFHLRKYGRPISNDAYYAMDYGPVASSVKDIAEMSDFLGKDEAEYAGKFLKICDDNSYFFQSVNNDIDRVFSASDIEALKYVWKNFGGFSEFELADLTHEYPEWKKHKNKLKNQSRVKMDYKDFFEDPDEAFDLCHSLSPEGKMGGIEHLKERAYLESLWN